MHQLLDYFWSMFSTGYLQSILNKPYPTRTSLVERFRLCVSFGLFVFLFLFIFQPFEMNQILVNKTMIMAGYGFVCFGVMVFLNIFLYRFIPRFFDENKWTVKREVLWVMINIVGVGVANFAYSFGIRLIPFSWSNFLLFVGYTFAIGIFPVLFITFLNQKRLEQKFEHESEDLNVQIEAMQPFQAPQEKISISGENGQIELTIQVDDFVFAESNDNYIDVYYLDDKGVQKKMIRNTLKNLAAFMPARPNIFRCHKSYLVNLDHIRHFSGNAQGYKLHLEGIDQLVPVSRTNNEFIKNYFADRP